MKILVVCQHYWPEPYPLTDICEELVRRGHIVHVITGVPNYPMGYIYDEYKNGKNREQVHNGVKITRTFTVGRRKNVLFRFLNYYSYSISSTLHVLGLQGDYDVVFANQTSPIMMVRAAVTYSKKWRKKCVLYCMDLWPASLAAGGIKQKSLIYKFFGYVSKKLYNKADKILITSRMFKNYFMEEHGIPEDKISYLPQYAEVEFENLAKTSRDEEINIVFAGNIGKAQSLCTAIEAARLVNNARVRWHIIGDGSEYENIKEQAKGMNNIIFYGRKPSKEMPKYYAMADAMLVTLTADPFISYTLPRKVQTYMAAGKPILAAANGEISDLIFKSGCGLCSGAENPRELAKNVERFISIADKERMGKNGKRYYKQNFSKESFMLKLETELKNAIQS